MGRSKNHLLPKIFDSCPSPFVSPIFESPFFFSRQLSSKSNFNYFLHSLVYLLLSIPTPTKSAIFFYCSIYFWVYTSGLSWKMVHVVELPLVLQFSASIPLWFFLRLVFLMGKFIDFSQYSPSTPPSFPLLFFSYRNTFLFISSPTNVTAHMPSDN